MANNNLKRLGLLITGGGMGGLLTLGVATLPAAPVLAGIGGTLLVFLSVWTSWMGVVLLFFLLGFIAGGWDRLPEVQLTVYFFLSLLMIVLFWVRQREKHPLRDPLTLPLVCWVGMIFFTLAWAFWIFKSPPSLLEVSLLFYSSLVMLLYWVWQREKQSLRDPIILPLLFWSAIVTFSVVPAMMMNNIGFEEWFGEALPWLTPALYLVIPRRFTNHGPLKVFLFVIILISIPVLWDFTFELLLYGDSYLRGFRMQDVRLELFQPLRDIYEPGPKGDYFFWQVEGFGNWIFFTEFALCIYAVSKPKKVIFALLWVFTFLMVFLWGRRTAFSGILVACLIFLLLLYRRRGWQALKQAAVLWFVICVFMPVALWGLERARVNVPKLVGAYTIVLVEGTAHPSFQWRFLEFPYALPAIAESPLIGHGIGYMIPGEWRIYPKTNQYEASSYLHNFGLNLLVKLGVFGFAAFIWLMVASFRVMLRSLRVTEDPLYQSLLLSGICTLFVYLWRCPLDDVFVSYPTLFSLLIWLAVANRVETDSHVQAGTQDRLQREALS